ncbi:hypothetical protein [Rhizobium lentis]|uniref:Uncharacterized protein n=1 Tax=Rhizobium lentis TaxID=1138194 RepID=A0A7W8XIM8_9HYPH|nr:hypothetical protein [Rhizobium lentis]MBB5554253.1 hypothetical protein [Rhizobium lentis]MBB5563617.1 hypothetical protein [Rhizobium lentis]MBB5571397.1 hypothetical protein [Rhizobium lentis]
MAENDIQVSLENCLQLLVGLPLSIARNAADMKVFHFGTIRPHPSGRGTVGAYALHVQCPWRFVDEKTIVTGTSDRFVEPADGTEPNDDDPKSGNLQLIKIASLLKGYDAETNSYVNATEQLVVIAVNTDNYGGADFLLSGGYRLQVFPDGSLGEDWRFVELQGRHVVIEGGRVQVDIVI